MRGFSPLIWAACSALPALALAPYQPASAATFDCVLYPSSTLKLGSPVASVLDSVMVNRGDVVKKGQIVASLESVVENAELNLHKEKAADTTDIDISAVKADLTKREYERQSTLNKTQATPLQKYDQAFAEYKLALQEGARAQLNHRLARLEVQRAEATLEQRVIRSPIDGVVTQRTLGPGEYVSQDASILTVAAIDPLYVETYLPTRYYRQIKVGDTATVRPSEPVGGERSARVIVVDQVFDAASGTFGVRLTLPNADHAIPGGFRCRIEFSIPEAPEPPAETIKELELEQARGSVGR